MRNGRSPDLIPCPGLLFLSGREAGFLCTHFLGRSLARQLDSVEGADHEPRDRCHG